MNAAIEWANGLATHWARGMWPVLWQTAALAAVVGLIVLSARRMSPALRFWLWMLVPMRLLVMPLIVITLPVLANPPAAHSQPAAAPSSFTSQAPAEAPALDLTAQPMSPAEPPSIAVQRQVRPSIWAWLMAGWFAGAGFFALRLARGWLRMKGIAGQARENSDGRVRDCAREAAVMLGLRNIPRIMTAAEGISPFVLGFFRPVVVLPAELADHVSADELRAVLAHEFAHVRRRDALVGWVLACSDVIYFFNPVVHLVKRAIILERERACDEQVLALAQAPRAVYARALLSATALTRPAAARLSCAPVLLESGQNLERRLKSIADERRPRAALSRKARLVLLAVAILALPGVTCVQRKATLPATTRLAEPTSSSLTASAENATQTSVVPLSAEEQARASEPLIAAPSLASVYTENIGNWSGQYGTHKRQVIFFILSDDAEGEHGCSNTLFVLNRWNGEFLPKAPGSPRISYRCDGTALEVNGTKYMLSQGRVFLISSGREPKVRQFAVSLEGCATKGAVRERLLKEDKIRAILAKEAELSPQSNSKAGTPTESADSPPSTSPLPRAIEIKDINAKVARLNLETATRDDVIALFGEPASYIWGNATFAKDNLPDRYIMFYSRAFSVVMLSGQVKEVRFEERGDYAFHGTLRVGSTLDEALKVMGPPDRTVEGGVIGFEDGVLYRDAQIRENGGSGVCYYARRDKGIRIFAVHNVLTALYLTRRPNETAQPTSSEYWNVLLILDFPNLRPPAVQFAIFERDPVPAFRNQVSRMRDLYLQLLAEGKGEFGSARAQGGQMEVAWDFGFRDTPGNEVSLLTSGSRKLIGSNLPAGKRWLVTKAVISGDKVLCWSIPFEADPHRPAVITLIEKNATDLGPIYDEAMSREINPPVAPVPSSPGATKVARGMLGIVIQDDPLSLKGALVTQVNADSPAAKAGVKAGDVILRYEGHEVESATQLRDMVAATAPDTEVQLDIIRNGKEEMLTVRVGNSTQQINVGPRRISADHISSVVTP